MDSGGAQQNSHAYFEASLHLQLLPCSVNPHWNCCNVFTAMWYCARCNAQEETSNRWKKIDDAARRISIEKLEVVPRCAQASLGHTAQAGSGHLPVLPVG